MWVSLHLSSGAVARARRWPRWPARLRNVVAVAVPLAVATGLLPGPVRAQTGDAAQQPALPSMAIPDLENSIVISDSTSMEGLTTLVFSGYVDIQLPDQRVRLQADQVRLSLEDFTFEATGNVTFDQSEVQIRGTRMQGDLDGGSGIIEDAYGIGPGDVAFRGERIEQLEPGLYRIEKGMVTPCRQALPIWEFSARTVRLDPESHAFMTWPTFKIKGVPVFVLPALYWPIDEEGRATGFLLPNIGTSTLRGFMVSESFFWAISRSADATFTVENYSKAGTGVGTEFRHAFAAGSAGRVRVYRLQGGRLGADELAAGQRSVQGGWSVDADHSQELPGGFRLNAAANFFTSTEFVQGFEDDFNRFLQRTSSAGGFLTGSWSVYTLNLVADVNRTFFGADSVVRQRFPEVEFRIRRKPIAGPLYFAFEGSAARLVRREEFDDDELGGAFNRLDGFPELSLQFSQIPWLTFSPFVSWRSTYYSHSSIGSAFEPEPIFRNVYETGVEMVGPSTFRIFDTPANRYSPRFKHVIEPRVTWFRSGELERDDLGRIIRFDEIDRFLGARNRVRVSLTNRFLAKRFPNDSADERSVWEVFSVEIAREFDLDERRDQEVFPTIPLPYSLTARVTPTEHVNFSGRADFTPELVLGGFNVSGNLNYPGGSAGITWFRSARTSADPEDPSRVLVDGFNRLSGGGRVDLLGRLFTVSGHTSYDVTFKELQEVALAAQWNTQCCSIGAQFRNLSFSFRDEQQFSIILELANVGSLGFGSDQPR